MRTRLVLFALPLALALAGCENPPPECAPRGGTYTICADDKVWECPDGPADAIAANLAQDEACNETADPIQCTLDADYTYVEMTLSIDCEGGGQVCVDDLDPGVQVATCEDPP